MTDKIKNRKTKEISNAEKKLERAKIDFNKLMLQVEPFIIKSDIIITSTEGKWYETSSTFEKVVPQNSIYQ
jgi:hypothetical protein